MVNVARIKLWGKEIGVLLWQESRSMGVFEFSESINTTGWDVSPLHMPLSERRLPYSFPLLVRTDTFKGLPGLFADVMPDRYGNALVNAWLQRHGRPLGSMNPVELLCFIGKRGMGAMEFEPAVVKDSGLAEKIEINDLVNVASDLLTNRNQFLSNLSQNQEKALTDILKMGTSAGGARAKALIAFNEETGEVRSGQADIPEGFTHCLLKFDGVHDAQFGQSSGYGRVEMAYYLMASEAGIDMMPSRLLEENGRAHFMTRRFDRDPKQGKLHMQSFCALQHADFNEVGRFSYELLFQTMRLLRLPYPAAEQLFRRMVFNVLARNCDDHTKNFAFLMNQQGEWSLAPAYDVCFAYRLDSIWVSQQSLTVNGKRQGITDADLLEVAFQMNIKKAKNVLAEVKQAIARWPEFAETARVEHSLAEHIGALHLTNSN
jgi:serine/threonine-protein kinase HipA